tara:strand:+ start:3700 stop:4812 length:1113 start_codon:yes stop_codon:yes gene_type:complete
MKNTKIVINTKSKNYPIYLGDGVLNTVGKVIKRDLPKVKKIAVISDKKVPSKFIKILKKSLKKYNVKIYKIIANEKTKSFKVANTLIEKLLQNNLNRSDCIISFGGGITSDLSAFVSNLTKRGIKFINIPTTLLAQVDASIGGKTAINSSQGKNLIGTFYQPDFVLMDLSILKSLPHKEMVCGYGEILKHSLIIDKKFFIWLCKNGKQIISNKNKKILKYAIFKSCEIKSKIVKKDEKEKNLRMILNFGHTFAHGFEASKNFSPKLNHGESVLLGMMMACRLAVEKGILPKKDLNVISKHYLELNLPMNIEKKFKKKEVKKIMHFMKKDKKNTNEKINLIFIKKIGKINNPVSLKINDSELKKFLLKSFN